MRVRNFFRPSRWDKLVAMVFFWRALRRTRRVLKVSVLLLVPVVAANGRVRASTNKAEHEGPTRDHSCAAPRAIGVMR